MNEGYKSRAFNLNAKPKKKRKEEFKVCDFVDSRKAIEGSSSDEEETEKIPRSKAARAELESEIPTESGPKLKNPSRGAKKKGFVKKQKVKDEDDELMDDEEEENYKVKHSMPSELRDETEEDEILKEINNYQKSSKGRKKKIGARR